MDYWFHKFKNHSLYKKLSLSPITLSDKELYSNYIKKTEFPVNVWSGNFTYLWSYNNSKFVKIFKFFLDDMLVTLILNSKGRIYLPTLPFGNANTEKLLTVLIKCGELFYEWNKESQNLAKALVNPINQPQLNFIESHPLYKRYFHVEELTGLERHYLVSNLANLSGNIYSRIRHKVNKFNRTYPHMIIRHYNEKDYPQVIALGKLWEKNSGQKYKRIIDNFYFKPIIQNYRQLGHIILVIELDGKIIGMTTAEILPTGNAWGCLTKFDKTYYGLSEKLTVEIAKYINSINPHVETINTGSDLGSEGLATYKERLRPIYNYKRYALFYNYHQ